MTPNQQQLFAVAYQLNQQGKTPTLGLLKAKLGKLLSTREILQGLQAWKANPELGKDIAVDVEMQQQSKAIDENALPDAVAALLKRIEALELRVSQLEGK